jgi:hypothetical protein
MLVLIGYGWERNILFDRLVPLATKSNFALHVDYAVRGRLVSVCPSVLAVDLFCNL